jgi:predicted phosphodiesterase
MCYALRLACCVLALSIAGCNRTAAKPAEARAGVTVEEVHPPDGALALPLKQGSVRFAVIGDSGRGDRAQYETGQRMAEWRAKFPFDFVIMLGDNIYDYKGPDDYVKRFEAPYAALLGAGVDFFAAIGNHDDPSQIYYSKFHMEGRRYYTYRKSEARLSGLTGSGVRFFVLDSRTFDPEQLAWLKEQLAQSGSNWKIVYFHHPLYTAGRYQLGARALRLAVEPILQEGGVDVVFSGHEHFYARLQPQNGIAYFVSGAAGALRRGDIRQSPILARGFDDDCHFILVEISGDQLFFQAINRSGQTVDAGVIRRGRTS